MLQLFKRITYKPPTTHIARYLAIEEQGPGIGSCGIFHVWGELRPLQSNVRHVGQNKVVGVGFGVRQMSPEGVIDGRAKSPSSAELNPGYSQPLAHVQRPSQEHVADDAKRQASAVFLRDPADEKLEMGFQKLRGFHETNEKTVRKGVRVFCLRRKTVVGAGEGQLRQADIQIGASGIDLGSQVSDVERRTGYRDGESGSFGKQLGELQEGDNVALRHEWEHHHMVLELSGGGGRQILSSKGGGRIHCG